MSQTLRWRALLSGATVLALAGTLSATLPTSAAPAPAAPAAVQPVRAGVVAPVPTLDWTRCKYVARSFCATAQVPLDYDDPTGPTLTLNLVKAPALEQSTRLGTLFVNPGGPGGSAAEFAPYAADLLGDTVALRYDVIGIDPRGVGADSQMSCTTSEAQPAAFWRPFPMTTRQTRKAWRQAAWIRDACRDGANEVVEHMSTADTARDMDLIRQAVGEPLLNYYGVSYGTQLGSTYAAMFPDLVGRVVLDSVLDPVAWSTGTTSPATVPFSTRLGSGIGAHRTMRAAMRECDAVGKRVCPLAPNAGEKWRKIKTRAKKGKLTIYDGRAHFADLIGGTLGSLYSTWGYDGLAYELAEIYRANFTPRSAARPGTERYRTSLEVWRQRAEQIRRAPYTPARARETLEAGAGNAFLGVACSDSDNPTRRRHWVQAADTFQAGGFGRLWTWASAPCAQWNPTAAEDRFAGPYATTTTNPVLIVSNAHDPATPITGARAVRGLLPNSVLVTTTGFGHGALENPCITAAFDDYYRDGSTPVDGTVCESGPLYGNFAVEEPWRLSDRAIGG